MSFFGGRFEPMDFRGKCSSLSCKDFWEIVIFRKCCYCVPLRCGVVMLMVLLTAFLTPYTLYARDPPWLYLTVGVMIFLVIAAIIFTGACVWLQYKCLLVVIGFSCPTLLFFIATLDYTLKKNYYTQEKEESVHFFLFVNNVAGIVTYIYFIFMMINTYVKLRNKVREREQELQPH